jgi:hypothetical protein
MNERFPPKGTPIKSFFFLVFAVAHLDYLLSFFRFFFWKKLCEEKRSKPQREAGTRKANEYLNIFFKHQNFKRYGTQHQFQRENRTSFIL